MDELQQKVLYLLAHGWSDLVAIQENLYISEEDMQNIIQWLIDEDYIISYTVH